MLYHHSLLLLLCLLAPGILFSQNTPPQDYGQKHLEAPDQLKDYEELIGLCHCTSTRRNADGFWTDTVAMTWTFKYVLGGYAIQDETHKEDGTFTSSLRQFNTDSSKWIVTYFSATSPIDPPTWTGASRKGNKMTLYRPQKAPNGMEGFSRLQFYDISDSGYKWIGEWVSQDESVAFPFWKIDCKKLN